MSSSPIDQASLASFTLKFSSCVTFWNHAESTARQIAQLLLGESAISMAVTAELGNRTLGQVIEVASHEMGEIGVHLRHFTSGYGKLLGYRNFYVHSLYAIRSNAELNAEGILYCLDGKGRVRYFNRTLSDDELEATVTSIHALIGYGAAIQQALGADGDGLVSLVKVYGASLEKPNWPPDVEKTPLYLQGQEPPPPKQHQKRGTPPAKPQP